MRVRIRTQIVSAYGNFAPGEIVDLPYDTARRWCRVGIAMEEKSLDGPSEVKETLKSKKSARNSRKKAK
jgi:hypothetical protein